MLEQLKRLTIIEWIIVVAVLVGVSRALM